MVIDEYILLVIDTRRTQSVTRFLSWMNTGDVMGETPPPSHNTTHVTLGAHKTPGKDTWVQVPRRSMELMGKLIGESPSAGQLLIAMTSKMGHHNALVASYVALAEMTGLSRSTIARSIDLLKRRNWISVVQLGPTKSTRAYVINDRVAWFGRREGLRNSLFSAAVLATSSDQEDMDELTDGPPLEEVPAIYRGEHQLPTGDGLPPPSEPAFPGMEHKLPERTSYDPETGEIIDDQQLDLEHDALGKPQK